MLHSLSPLAFVLASVWPRVCTKAAFQVQFIGSIETSAVGPFEHTLAIHLVFLPRACVLPLVSPLVCAMTMYLIVFELALIVGPILPREIPRAVLLPSPVCALIPRAIGPALHSEAILLVCNPLAFVLGSIPLLVQTISMCLVLLPLTVVGVLARVVEPPAPILLVVCPVSSVPRVVRPNLLTLAMSLVAEPFTFELRPIWISMILTIQVVEEAVIHLLQIQFSLVGSFFASIACEYTHGR
mmetsp:Transcript_113725/g.322036  ORF Transcript_113725/g.322036 Transcript_113725/m.322036 type:complete len:241 (+) Transcript_113725:357-1079(+)